MEIITNTTDFYLEKETAAALGKFDGVHIGHRRLLEEILARGRERETASCVFTFDPVPAVFFGYSDGRELTTKKEKRLLFERMGVDILIEFPLNERTAAISPEDFAADVLAKRMNVRFLAAGTDLSFGAGGAGDVSLLRKLAPELGFEIKTIDKVCLEGREVSSTYIKSRVEAGDMREVERLLGAPYPVAGRVVKGNQLGRTLGFPTVNLLPEQDKLLPPNGVYYSKTRWRGKLYNSISNVGYKPTVSAEKVMGVETYLYDFDGTAYGEDIEVYLCEFRRPERRFDGTDALREQLKQDILAGADFFAF